MLSRTQPFTNKIACFYRQNLLHTERIATEKLLDPEAWRHTDAERTVQMAPLYLSSWRSLSVSCGKRSSGTIFNLVFRGWAHVLYGTNLPGASHMSNLTLVFDERRHAFRAYRVLWAHVRQKKILPLPVGRLTRALRRKSSLGTRQITILPLTIDTRFARERFIRWKPTGLLVMDMHLVRKSIFTAPPPKSRRVHEVKLCRRFSEYLCRCAHAMVDVQML